MIRANFEDKTEYLFKNFMRAYFDSENNFLHNADLNFISKIDRHTKK
jgi:hypothetical protein